MLGDLCAAVGKMPVCRDFDHSSVRRKASGCVSRKHEVLPRPFLGVDRRDAHTSEDVPGREACDDPSFHGSFADAPFVGDDFFSQQICLVSLGSLAARHGALLSAPDIRPRTAPLSVDLHTRKTPVFQATPNGSQREGIVGRNIRDSESVIVRRFHALEIALKRCFPKHSMIFSEIFGDVRKSCWFGGRLQVRHRA